MIEPRALTADERIKLKVFRDEVANDAVTWFLKPGDANLETLRISTEHYVEALKETIKAAGP